MDETKTKLEILGGLAEFVDTPEVVDALAPSALRQLRVAADEVAGNLDKMEVPLTADVVIAMMLGATMERITARGQAGASPLRFLLDAVAPADDSPVSVAMSFVLSHLAKDVLTS